MNQPTFQEQKPTFQEQKPKFTSTTNKNTSNSRTNKHLQNHNEQRHRIHEQNNIQTNKTTGDSHQNITDSTPNWNPWLRRIGLVYQRKCHPIGIPRIISCFVTIFGPKVILDRHFKHIRISIIRHNCRQ